MLEQAIGTLIGFLSGVATVLLVSYIVVRSERNKLKKEAEQIKLKQEDLKKKYEIVRPRLKQVADISNKQLELYAQTQEPSKNSLHSKWKNDIISEIKELEKEKRSILRSIIKEGFDPDLSLTDDRDGRKETVRLSEYMARNGISLSEADDKIESAAAPRKNKFFVIEGGKSDVTH